MCVSRRFYIWTLIGAHHLIHIIRIQFVDSINMDTYPQIVNIDVHFVDVGSQNFFYNIFIIVDVIDYDWCTIKVTLIMVLI
jgi:hypothetical protein